MGRSISASLSLLQVIPAKHLPASLTITQSVQNEITTACQKSNTELVFLLGCSSRLGCIDRCAPVTCIYTTTQSCQLDVSHANRIIKSWYDNEICFYGVLHSHVVEKYILSEHDRMFAESMFLSFHMDQMCMALAVSTNKTVHYFFYQIFRDLSGSVQLIPTAFQTVQ